MPDSFPPPAWGPPPFDERDLEALLSGAPADPPLALRQVADALAALRAAPSPAELTGESMARAEFRAHVLDEGARTDGLPYAQVLSALTLDGTHRPPARHKNRPVRRRRGATWPASRRAGILLSAAAVVVIAVVVALTGNLPGPIHGLVRSTANSMSPTTRHSSRLSPSLNVFGSGPAEPSASRTPSARPTHRASSASHPSTAQQTPPQASECRSYYGYFLQSHPGQWSKTEASLLGNLKKLAGGYSHVYAYCATYLGSAFMQGLSPWAHPQAPPLPPTQPGTTSPGNSQAVTGNNGSGQERKTSSPAAP